MFSYFQPGFPPGFDASPCVAARTAFASADLVFDPTLACGLLWLWQVTGSPGRTYTKETAMLIGALVRRRRCRLPTARTYVGSFGPFYLELATTDRMVPAVRAIS